MIHLFQGRRKLFSFPKKWANSIVRWISGICSPSGTIKVSNTMDPGDDASLELDVNMDAVAANVLERFEVRPVTNEERDRMKHLLRGMLDGSTILMSDGHIYVASDWIEDMIENLLPDLSNFVTLDTAQTIQIGRAHV